MTRAFAVLAVLAACSGAPRQVGSEPSWRQAAAPARVDPATVFAPTDPPALRYAEPAQAPPSSPLGDAVLASARSAAVAAKQPAPIADARLFRACAELAQVVPEQGVVGYGLVEFALQRNGIAEPSPHLLVVWGPIDAPGPIVDQLAPQMPSLLANAGATRIGVGAAQRRGDGTGAVVFAIQSVNLTMTPVPRALPDGGSAPIEATIDPHFHDPEVLVTYDDGSTEQLAHAARGDGFVAQLQCGAHHGRQEVEIGASDPSGSPTVLANFPVWCGAEPPATYAIEARTDDGPVAPDVAEKRLFELVNQARRTAHLPALVWDDQLAQVARAHSEDMRQTGIVAHVSPTTGSAADRVKAAGIRTAVVLENVARAYGIGEAHQGLMNSPGHRANLMSNQVTHLGTGVVFGDEVSGRREIFITQVFIRVPPKLEVPQAIEQVRQRLAAVRPVGNDPALSEIAQDIANGLAAGRTREQAYAPVKRRVDGLGQRYMRIGSIITAVADLESIDGPTTLGDARPDEVGVGIAQGTHPEIGDNAIWVVVIAANRRP
ncbi:MAG: CAP domain-containing protein [Kofleriaceae bacterium]